MRRFDQKFTAALARFWDKTVSDQRPHLVGDELSTMRPPWDGATAHLPTRLAPIQHPKSLKRHRLFPDVAGSNMAIKPPRRHTSIPHCPAASLSLGEDHFIPPPHTTVNSVWSETVSGQRSAPVQDNSILPRAGLWQNRVKTPVLHEGAFSTSAWDDSHPLAAVRPRTSVRWSLLSCNF